MLLFCFCYYFSSFHTSCTNKWKLQITLNVGFLYLAVNYLTFCCISGSTNTVQAGVQSTATTVPDSSSHQESDLDNMYLLLEPHLRPATPDLNDPKSRKLFEEHKQLAQDFLKVRHQHKLLTYKLFKNNPIWFYYFSLHQNHFGGLFYGVFTCELSFIFFKQAMSH